MSRLIVAAWFASALVGGCGAKAVPGAADVQCDIHSSWDNCYCPGVGYLFYQCVDNQLVCPVCDGSGSGDVPDTTDATGCTDGATDFSFDGCYCPGNAVPGFPVCTNGKFVCPPCPGPDGSGDVPDMADSADVAVMDCAKLVADWATFVLAHQSCVADTDCKVVGGTGSCDLAAAIGGASGDVISASAAQAAQPLLDAFYGPACKAYRDAHGSWDAAPLKNPRCEVGQCQADWASCLTPPNDVSQPDATAGD